MATVLTPFYLFISWARTFTGFYLFGMFRAWTWEQVDFFEKHYKPQNKRDKRLKDDIIKYNRLRLWQLY